MIYRASQKIDNFCFVLEKRLGLSGTAAILSFLIIGLAMLYITPHFEAAYHGLQYSRLSEAPFDFTQGNSLRNRVLPSLIGYLIFLRGDLFFIVPLIFALLFIGTTYYVYP
ncbi:MAG: hypothetical protein WAQ28_19675 [Bacteroidia bacterium]|jgi:hypothetical protein